MALAFESPLSHTLPKMDGGLQRPQSALARGVHITELTDGCTNPQPIVFQESDLLMEQYLSPTKLQALTGCDNLETVTSLNMKVDSSETSLNNFGALLPNLMVLRLTGSVIPNIRDLGSSLRHLEVLWMSQCGLGELDGVSSMLRLRELYLAYNEVSDISALAMLEDLETLDLEGNNVDNIEQVQYLTLCTKLSRLTLEGNPICITPNVDTVDVDYDYRMSVKKILVNLSVLDDEPLDDLTPGGQQQNVFEADWAYLEELQRDALVMESIEDNQDNNSVSPSGRPTTGALRPATAYRPGSALRPSSGFRPMSSARRPASISGGRPSSAWTENKHRRPASSDAAEGMESSSDLTRGVVICGNPSKALRARRHSNNSQESTDQSSPPDTSQSATPTETTTHSPVKPQIRSRGGGGGGREEEVEEGWKGVESAASAEAEEGELSNDLALQMLVQELHSWKMDHEKRLEKIRESKAPQVFTIQHNNADSDLSNDHSDLSDTDDLDLRADSAMDLYHHQQAEWSHLHAGSSSGDARTQAASPEAQGLERESTWRKNPQQERDEEQKLKKYERSPDEDQHLLKEYQRLQELQEKTQAAAGEAGKPGTPRGSRGLRELKVPSAGPARLDSPRRGVSPKPASFPVIGAMGRGMGGMSADLLSSSSSPFGAGLEAGAFGRDQRPRKIKIGPTGLPGSSHVQQPQIRDLLTPPGKPGLGGLQPHSTLRPPSSASTSLQHRFRRTLPEVPPLPSRPPPVTKS